MDISRVRIQIIRAQGCTERFTDTLTLHNQRRQNENSFVVAAVDLGKPKKSSSTSGQAPKPPPPSSLVAIESFFFWFKNKVQKS